jgi:hypothetical protein
VPPVGMCICWTTISYYEFAHNPPALMMVPDDLTLFNIA